MKTIFSALILVLSASAARADSVQDSIADHANVIRNEVYRSRASYDDLQRADQLMSQALSLILSSGGGGNNGTCNQFAYEKYFADYSASVAQDKAAAACRQIADVAVAQFLWAKYYADYSSSVAMDRARDGSGFGTVGRADIISFAWSKYYADYSSSVAADKASQHAPQVAQFALNCLQQAWTNYYNDYSSSVSMDKAFDACR
jgi:hypothetical protein